MKLRALPLVVLMVISAALLGACKPNSSTGGDVANATGGPTSLPVQNNELTQSPPQIGSSTTAVRTVVDHFGTKCAKIPTDPSSPASFAAMGDEPAATALSQDPLTGRLYEALEATHLTDVLNTAGNLTILAPSDEAFAQLPAAVSSALFNNTTRLTKVLTYHVIPDRLTPEQLSGNLTTLEGSHVIAKGSKPDITVGPSGTEAHVVCGNIITRNATIYVIDDVLMPPS